MILVEGIPFGSFANHFRVTNGLVGIEALVLEGKWEPPTRGKLTLGELTQLTPAPFLVNNFST